MPQFKIRPRGGGCPGRGSLGGLGQLGFIQVQSLLLAQGTGRYVAPVGRGEVAMGFGKGLGWLEVGSVLLGVALELEVLGDGG